MFGLQCQHVRRAENVVSETLDPLVVALCTTLVHCSGGVVISKRSLSLLGQGVGGRCSQQHRSLQMMSLVVHISTQKLWGTDALTPQQSSLRVVQEITRLQLLIHMFTMDMTIGFYHRKMNLMLSIELMQ
jgi:hypothetical protein